MIELEHDAPDLEDLAAYLDGRLSGERKTQVEERLLRDEDYYDLFLENVRYQEEQTGNQGQGEVVTPVVWWRSWKGLAPLAVAAATLLAAVGLWQWSQAPPIDGWLAALDPTVVTASDGWEVTGWGNLRGGSDDPTFTLDARQQNEHAFRIGTRVVDLRIALAAADYNVAMQAARQLDNLTGEDPVLVLISNGYQEIQEQITNQDLKTLSTRAAELETYLTRKGFEGVPADRYALGAWNESGRLAALAGNAEALDDVWRDRGIAKGIPEIATHLNTLTVAIEQLEPDFLAAQQAFSGIAHRLAGRR